MFMSKSLPSENDQQGTDDCQESTYRADEWNPAKAQADDQE